MASGVKLKCGWIALTLAIALLFQSGLPIQGQFISRAGLLQSVVDSSVSFFLFTNDNPDTAQTIHRNNLTSLQQSHYNQYLPLRCLIHGYVSDRNSIINRVIKDAFLNFSDYNIIVVDWSTLARLDYSSSATLTRYVGRSVASFIQWLLANGYLQDLQDVHVIGHSLGAHVGGFCGKALNGMVGVIHGLDPAGLLLWTAGPADRLASTDAQYVQCISTNAGTIGINKPVCDINFYPNYGVLQPACGLDPLCSHKIVQYYFAEAISNPNMFYAKECTSADEILHERHCNETGTSTYMGTYAQPPPFYGSYYLPVRSRPPYGYGVF